MPSYLFALLGAIAVFAAYWIISTIVGNRRHAREAERLGCKAVPERPHKLPLGIDFVLRALKADKEKLFPTDMMNVYHEVGNVATWNYEILGNSTYMTVDPKNIQAILATQFDEFALRETRRGNFFPMLGNGIFTTDGKSW